MSNVEQLIEADERIKELEAELKEKDEKLAAGFERLKTEKEWSKKALLVLMSMNAEINETKAVQPVYLIHWDKKIRELIAETGNVIF